ncbi:uncharacterized protein [Rutidosis leptorrhynchoides]|uniref:uncharacterized protein n=1 Tax=Rutidosis leptorrhynchoides TaxID=125765 RepID=UPI003A9918C0
MVFSGNRDRQPAEEEEESNMERLKPLHNFDLPCLKWGNQKLLRCMKVNSNGDVSAVDRKHSPEIPGGSGGGDITGIRRRDRVRVRSVDDQKIDGYKFSSSEKLKSIIAGEGEIEATREKLIFDFQTEVGIMKDAILRGKYVSPAPVPPSTSDSPAERPWNLRTRRVNGNGDSIKPDVSPVRIECNKSPIHRRVGVGGGGNDGGATATTSGEKRERPKFSVSLSCREIEDDFVVMAGRRLPRKPKKRPRVIQKQLDTLFPGLWLTEITADLYRVPDETETGKR